MPDQADLLVRDDDTDFYGRRYYEQHLIESYGFLPLAGRARTDFVDRAPHWMRVLLKYRLPPAQVLELGSAHGGFVAMMRWAGFDATGLELSPWLAERAREMFGVPMLVGPVEAQQIPPGSLDVIVLLDVLEHLSDPAGTLRHCSRLLAPDGIFLIQTPEYRDDMDYERLLISQDRFLLMLEPQEHLHLFSRGSAAAIFAAAGFPHLAFEPAVFGFYDMFFVAGRRPPVPHGDEEVEAALSAAPSGRLVLAQLDTYASLAQYKDRWVPELQAAAEERLRALVQADSDLRQALTDNAELRKTAEERLEALLRADSAIAELAKTAEERLEALVRADSDLKGALAANEELRREAEQRLQALRDVEAQLRGAEATGPRMIAAFEEELAGLRARHDRAMQELLALRKETLIRFFIRRYFPARLRARINGHSD